MVQPGLSAGTGAGCASIQACRQAGHQQPTASLGTATAGGSNVHQHGSCEPFSIAQPNAAPQRVQVLIGVFPNGPVTQLWHTSWRDVSDAAGFSWPEYSSDCCNKIQQDAALPL